MQDKLVLQCDLSCSATFWTHFTFLAARKASSCRCVCFCQEEEEDGSDEDSMNLMTVDERPVPPPRRTTRPSAGEEDSDRDSDPAFVSPLDEVKAVRQQPALNMANLHEASRCVRDALTGITPLNIETEHQTSTNAGKILCLSSNQTRSQLLECLRETRAEKKTRRKALRAFEDEFYRQTGR